jgi:quercetin dioxygenase-like cupin family protein
MKNVEHKSLNKPDEVRNFPHGKVDLINIGEGTVGRLTLEPGWRWSTDVKPVAGTNWCEAPHFQVQLSGRLRVKMESGEEFELGTGDVSCLPSGHDAWVVGNEPVVLVDWYGATNYAKQGAQSAQKK